MKPHDKTKICPKCFEEVRAATEICRYCGSRIEEIRDGERVRVTVKTTKKTYRGHLFVGKTERMSDAINDSRRFVVLTEAFEEGKLGDISIGFVALNKRTIVSVRFSETEDMKPFSTRDR